MCLLLWGLEGEVIALQWFVDSRQCQCRVEDYWHGYKLFCYAFYSHSAAHESEFKDSKLGALLSCTPRSLLLCLCTFRCQLVCGVVLGVCLTSPLVPLSLCLQVTLCGIGLLRDALLPIMRYEPLACSFFHSSKCTASTCCKRIAPIYGGSWSVMTARRNWPPTNWAAQCWR